MKRPPDKKIPVKQPYRCIKLAFKQIAKPDIDYTCIYNAVLKMNDIITRATLFLKDYILSSPNEVIPLINEIFLDCILITVCEIKESRGRPPSPEIKELRVKLKKYYDENFKKLLPENALQLDYNNLNTVFDYTAKSWITAIKNNVTLRYVSYVESYVNHCFNKTNEIENIRKNTSLTKDERLKTEREFLTRLRKIKNQK
jgi:hypothetical protein